MERKKWTRHPIKTDSLLKFNEKKKWQLALRRYVLDKNISAGYAFYFGLDIEQFRAWIEIQFSEGLGWKNFGTGWQFDHIVPVTYFDFSLEDDLILCWNFINIKIERIEPDKKGGGKIAEIAVKAYFESLYTKTGYSLCLKMVDKIKKIESSHTEANQPLGDFIVKKKEQLEIMAVLTKDEFNSLNTGMSLQDILLEKEIIKKFGQPKSY